MLSLTEYEKIAILILLKYKIKVTNETLGEIITGISMADFKYDPTKGHLEYYRSLYANYYYGNMKKIKKRKNKEVPISVIEEGLAIKGYDKSLILFSSNKDKDFNSKEMLEFINTLKLSDREKRIIYLRFWKGYKLYEIEKLEDVGLKRVHQIIQIALRKIKSAIKLAE